MANEFDLGLNIASIETELPDPVITLTGSDTLTASETAKMPLLALTAYGRSWQGERVVNVADIGIEGYGIPVSSGGNYTDDNGQQWVCDELIVNADGTGKIINRIKKFRLPSESNWTWAVNRFGIPYTTGLNTSFIPEDTGSLRCLCTHFIKAQCLIYGTWIDIMTADFGGDATVFKDFLSNNAVYTYYPLATPTETELTPEQLTALQPLVDKYGAFKACFMSTQDGTPTPENPVEIVSAVDLHRVSVPIESIGDSGSVTVTSCGKNLFDPSLCSSYTGAGVIYTNNDDGTFTVKGTATSWAGSVSDVFILPKGTYMLSTPNKTGQINVSVSDGAKNYYAQFTLSDATEVKVIMQAISGATVDTTFSIQIEKGAVATDYEPYKSTTTKIATALPLRGIPVSNGGNYTDSNGQEWVCDTLEHIYGEPAQYVQRVEKSKAVIVDEYNLREHGAAVLTRWRDDSNPEPLLTYYEKYLGEYGIFSVDDLDGHRHCKLYGIDKYELRRPPYYPNPYIGGYQYSQFGWDIDSPNYEGLEFVLLGDWRYEDGSPYEGARPGFALENGKDIPKEYICTTGVVTAGAEIIYPEKENITLLTTAETEELNSLSGFTGSTTIYNDSTAEMTVKLLREDFEMQYIHWIKESQSYVCEKAGKYKIICVGGGSSGGIGATGAAEIMQAAGTTTSFGTIISAEGGGKSRALVGSTHIGSGTLVGGQSGYDGINYGSTSHVMTYESTVHFSSTGSNSSVMWGTGHGYGAGGGARSCSDNLLAAGGRCGKVESTIVDLEENQTIACTIGGGGVLKLSDANVLDYLKTYVDKETTSASGMGERVSACVSDGADGVIIIQYLGV